MAATESKDDEPKFFDMPVADIITLQISSAFLKRLWGLHESTPFVPCSNPVSLSRATLVNIKNNPSEWWVSQKADGERRFLLLGNADSQPYSVFVSRKGRVTDATCFGPLCAYEGTLVDGEWISDPLDGGPPLFLVFDIIADSGYIMRYKPYEERLSALRRFVEGDAKTTRPPHAIRGVRMVCKPVFRVSENGIARVLDTVPTLYGSDGVVATNNNAFLEPGIVEGIVKYKEEHTLDLGAALVLPKTSPDGAGEPYIALAVGAGALERVAGDENLPDGWVFPRRYKLFLENSGGVVIRNGDVVECKVGIDMGHAVRGGKRKRGKGEEEGEPRVVCRPVRVRADKKIPNNDRVVMETFSCILQHIKEEELRACT